MKQKNILFTFLFLSLSLSAFPQIKGNGQMETRIRSINVFSQLEVDFPAHVTVNCKELAKLEITTDENVFKGIAIKHEGGKLRILQESWISPTKPVEIIISTPFLVGLKTGGYGHFYINNLDGALFQLDNPVGTVQLAGKIEKLKVNMKQGNLDALQLHAKEVEVAFDGYGEAKVQVESKLKVKVAGKNETRELTLPTSFRIQNDEGEDWLTEAPWKEEKEIAAPRRIEFKLLNNSGSKADFYVQGPKGHRFSYGFPIKARMKRKENWPIGTKIYLDRILGRKLLHTVSADDENQTIALFK